MISKDTPTIVRDSIGAEYKLGRQLGRGGQGAVYAVEGRPIAIKLYDTHSDAARRRLEENIAYLRRLPLDGLKVARPIRTLTAPHCGYVMDLMTDMVSLSSLVEIPRAELGNVGFWYTRTGGLRRRLEILAAAAKTLQTLHAAGLSYGDPSPANFFISSDPQHSEVWLIDCDNLSDGRIKRNVFTRGYAAPELFRTHNANTLTDAYAFAIIAYRTLVQRHPFIGDEVEDGDPDFETDAFEGKLPWIDDAAGTNASSRGITRDWVITPKLRTVFQNVFGLGRVDPLERPGLAALAEQLQAAARKVAICPACQASYFVKAHRCPWCDHARPEIVLVTLSIANQEGEREPGEEPRLTLNGQAVTVPIATMVFQPGYTLDLTEADLLGTTSSRTMMRLEYGGSRVFVTVPSLEHEWVVRTLDGTDHEIIGQKKGLDARRLSNQLWLMPRHPKGMHRVFTLTYYPAQGAV